MRHWCLVVSSRALSHLFACRRHDTTDMYPLQADIDRDLLHLFTHAHDSHHATFISQPGFCTFFSQIVPCICISLFIWHALMGAVFFPKEGVH